mgnify:CR=1 FL=1
MCHPMAVTTASIRPRTRASAYLALTKPRIIELLLVTTVPTMVWRVCEHPDRHDYDLYLNRADGTTAANSGDANAARIATASS